MSLICPACGAEYRKGFEYCADCQIPLIANIPLKGKPGSPIRLVPVFEAANAAQVSVAKAILDGADILYNVRNEGLQSLFGMGSMGTGFSPLSGAVVFEVEVERAEEAKLLLADLSDGGAGADDDLE